MLICEILAELGRCYLILDNIIYIFYSVKLILD